MVSALLLFSWTELFFGKDKVLQQKARFPMGLLVVESSFSIWYPRKYLTQLLLCISTVGE